MKTSKLFLSLIILLLFSSQLSYALNTPGHTLQVILINQSQNKTLTYLLAKSQYPNITFEVSNKEIPPNGGTSIITGKVNCEEQALKLCNDLSGTLYFGDNTGYKNHLTILDRIQSHASQGIFSMDNQRFSSVIKNKILNKSGKPNELTVLEVTVEITDKN